VCRCRKLPTKAQIFEGDAPYILNAFCCQKNDCDSVDENSCRYQNSDSAFAGGNLSWAIASKCCRRNPNRSIDWHLAVLDSAKVRSMWAIASGRSSLKLDGFSQQEAEFGSEFDIG
jgi:hypothetical protein